MLLYISAIGMILTLSSLGGYFYAKDVLLSDVSNISWLPLASLMIFVTCFSIGYGPIPWLMMGEILPAKIRGSAASVATGFNWTCTFIVTKSFDSLMGECISLSLLETAAATYISSNRIESNNKSNIIFHSILVSLQPPLEFTYYSGFSQRFVWLVCSLLYSKCQKHKAKVWRTSNGKWWDAFDEWVRWQIFDHFRSICNII